MRFLGALDGSAWQEAWKRPRDEGALVVIELASGETVYGQAADGTEIDFPPRPPAVFLPYAYRLEEEGAPIRMEMGIYIPGEQIAAAYFAANDGSAVPTPARRLVPTEG